MNAASSLNNICKIRQNLDVCISDGSMTLCAANIVVCLRSFCKSLKLSTQFGFNPRWHKARSAGGWQEGWARFQSWKLSDPGAVQVFSCTLCAQTTGSDWISVTHKNTGFVYYLWPFAVPRYNVTGWISALGNISAMWSTNPNNFTAKYLFQVFSLV